MKTHHFDIDIAKRVGVEPAVMYDSLCWWLSQHRANGRHQLDGHTWTYQSAGAAERLWPYWSRRQIQRNFQKLIEAGLLYKATAGQQGRLLKQDHRSAMDRSAWYAVADESDLPGPPPVEPVVEVSGASLPDQPSAGNGKPEMVPSIARDTPTDSTECANGQHEMVPCNKDTVLAPINAVTAAAVQDSAPSLRTVTSAEWQAAAAAAGYKCEPPADSADFQGRCRVLGLFGISGDQAVEVASCFSVPEIRRWIAWAKEHKSPTGFFLWAFHNLQAPPVPRGTPEPVVERLTLPEPPSEDTLSEFQRVKRSLGGGRGDWRAAS